MKFYTNPAKDDELCERTDIVDSLYIDPINPKLGYYYLFDELRNRIHTHFDGNRHFTSWESARFARSCSTMWPFLKIYRHWNYSEAKQQVIKDKKKNSSKLFKCYFNKPEKKKCGLNLKTK